jgi:hypothetical protein
MKRTVPTYSPIIAIKSGQSAPQDPAYFKVASQRGRLTIFESKTSGTLVCTSEMPVMRTPRLELGPSGRVIYRSTGQIFIVASVNVADHGWRQAVDGWLAF